MFVNMLNNSGGLTVAGLFVIDQNVILSVSEQQSCKTNFQNMIYDNKNNARFIRTRIHEPLKKHNR